LKADIEQRYLLKKKLIVFSVGPCVKEGARTEESLPPVLCGDLFRAGSNPFRPVLFFNIFFSHSEKSQ
jgi:hypothetical protein